MKSLLTLAAGILLAIALRAQPTLEHTYPSFSANRLIHFDYGSAYFYISSVPGERTFFFFDSTHQPIQTVTINAPDSLPTASSSFFSHDLFDADPEYEVLQFWYAGGNTPAYGFVYDDDGTVLNPEPFVGKTSFPFFRAYSFDDGTWQLLVDGRIYDLQSYQLLHTVTDNATNPFGYKPVGLDRKYCYMNTAGQFVALNQDFTVFQQSVPLANPACNLYLEVLEQRDINPNDALEWLLWQNCGPSDPTVSVYSGSALQFTYAAPGEIMNQPSVMLPRYVPGIDAPKLMVSSSTTTSTQVFDMLSGDVDWFTPGIYILRRTEPGSSFYSRASLTADETEHTVYGMDYQPVGNYPKPAGLTASILDVSRRTFDDDSITVEVMLRIGTTLPYIEVRQPGNAALFTVDSAGSATLSRFEGLQNKLLARTNLQPIWTKVFDLGSQTPVAAVEPKQGFPLLVWPNPVADRLFLDPQTFPAGKADVRITDALGRVVWQQHVSAPEVLEVNTARWPAGMYVVQVVSGGKTSSRTVVKQ